MGVALLILSHCRYELIENHDFDDAEIPENGEENSGSQAQKRKSLENAVPRLVDNKRKHLEKNLSAAERDRVLFKYQ